MAVVIIEEMTMLPIKLLGQTIYIVGMLSWTEMG